MKNNLFDGCLGIVAIVDIKDNCAPRFDSYGVHFSKLDNICKYVGFSQLFSISNNRIYLCKNIIERRRNHPIL